MPLGPGLAPRTRSRPTTASSSRPPGRTARGALLRRLRAGVPGGRPGRPRARRHRPRRRRRPALGLGRYDDPLARSGPTRATPRPTSPSRPTATSTPKGRRNCVPDGPTGKFDWWHDPGGLGDRRYPTFTDEDLATGSRTPRRRSRGSGTSRGRRATDLPGNGRGVRHQPRRRRDRRMPRRAHPPGDDFDPASPSTYDVEEIPAPDKPIGGKGGSTSWPTSSRARGSTSGSTPGRSPARAPRSSPRRRSTSSCRSASPPSPLWLQPRGSTLDLALRSRRLPHRA
jgi:hypothetical protein